MSTTTYIIFLLQSLLLLLLLFMLLLHYYDHYHHMPRLKHPAMRELQLNLFPDQDSPFPVLSFPVEGSDNWFL